MNPKAGKSRRAANETTSRGEAHARRLRLLGAAPDVIEASVADPAGEGWSDATMRRELAAIEAEARFHGITP